MLETIVPIRFHAAVTSGRTKPARIECEKQDKSTVEVVAKFSEGCDRKGVGLAMEVVAASLAADLGLPVPCPYLLDMQVAFVASMADADLRKLMQDSHPVAFGSTNVGSGFRIWSTADKISGTLAAEALAIFCFDGFIVNDDRRTSNPNLLVKGSEIRIIDHESAFVHRMLALSGWRPPWVQGGLAPLASPGHHIFYAGLRGLQLDLGPVELAWTGITDARLQEYRNSVPHQWAASAAVDDAINLIRDIRGNIQAALTEVRRVLA
jgi:hypothetical protein